MSQFSVKEHVSWEGRKMFIAYSNGNLEMGHGWTAEDAMNAAIRNHKYWTQWD